MNTEFHSTRLFPKNLGADQYVITGIANKCDCVILTDRNEPKVHVEVNCEVEGIRYIFLSMREPFVALKFFVETILPNLVSPFILISGSEDITIPTQIDKRWRNFNSVEIGYINTIIDSSLLIRWFCENLDTAHPKMEALPLGMVYPNPVSDRVMSIPISPPVADRPLKVLCAHRVRSGEQWQPRVLVTGLAKSQWSDFCTVVEEEISEPEYMELVKQHSFVICVNGGGIDPSPKAWSSILYGAIPIIQKSPLMKAYDKFPVAFVDEWLPESINKHTLSSWRNDVIQRFYTNNKMNDSVRIKLGLDFWWDQVVSCYEDTQKSAIE